MNKLFLYLHTLRYLKPIQIRYRIYYTIRNKIVKRRIASSERNNAVKFSFFNLIPGITPPQIYHNGRYKFLNTPPLPYPPYLKRDLAVEYSKLWIYNLFYFDYLFQPSMTRETGLQLIVDFIRNNKRNPLALDPYPTSLRIVNWTRFISRHTITDATVIASLHDQCNLLVKNIEYHLLGNHLLENGFALFTAGLFFHDPGFYERGKQILKTQLNEQILLDGGHFELSPMYHSIILNRVLDSINILQNNPEVNQELLPFLKEKAALMIHWIREMTFSSGDIPLFNDTAKSIAPNTNQLVDYAEALKLSIQKPNGYTLSDSGYRKYCPPRYELIMDVGPVGPAYIPGHAHADMLNFELQVDRNPFIVDTGTSTYLAGSVRSYERSTSAHNTITIDKLDQSELWASHRVGRRANINLLQDELSTLTAEVQGYFPLKALAVRTFSFYPDKILIRDKGIRTNNKDCYAFFHFHPDVSIRIDHEKVMTNLGVICFSGHQHIDTIKYFYAPEFNVRIPSQCLRIQFSNELITTIEI